MRDYFEINIHVWFFLSCPLCDLACAVVLCGLVNSNSSSDQSVFAKIMKHCCKDGREEAAGPVCLLYAHHSNCVSLAYIEHWEKLQFCTPALVVLLRQFQF